MASGRVAEYVAECLWPDVAESDLEALDERAHEQARRLTSGGESVRYLGSLLMREDEVVLCLFQGELDAVRTVATTAQIPFERILETARSPWRVSEPESAGDGSAPARRSSNTRPNTPRVHW